MRASEKLELRWALAQIMMDEGGDYAGAIETIARLAGYVYPATVVARTLKAVDLREVAKRPNQTFQVNITEPTKHDWMQEDCKPWTCRTCGFRTANLRHIQNGFCKHSWGTHLGLPACNRCGIVRNNVNTERPCIGSVKITQRSNG